VRIGEPLPDPAHVLLHQPVGRDELGETLAEELLQLLIRPGARNRPFDLPSPRPFTARTFRGGRTE
ncbi:hypothetical protein, partial [Streptomyces sp.]|uniref:hypothetical protein n=1 Tax=Streptomyces sp. TaxID=1931 RepID=UPI002811D268